MASQVMSQERYFISRCYNCIGEATALQPLMPFVWDYPGEPVPER